MINLVKLNYTSDKVDEILKEMAIITIDNLSYIYGDDMKSNENIKSYVEYKKQAKPITYLMHDETSIFGYLTLSLSSKILYIEDIQIKNSYRNNPGVMSMILKTITIEYLENKNQIDKVVYYINKKNKLSQHNFSKFAEKTEETKNSYMYELNLEHPFIVKMIDKVKKQ